MIKPLSELINKISKANTADGVKSPQAVVEMDLNEIRRVRGVTQNQIAKTLQITQPGVSQLEKRNNIYISTLRSYLSCLNAQLELIAIFPDGTKIVITGFNSLDLTTSETDHSSSVTQFQ